MKKQNKLLNPILSLLFAFALLFTGLNTNVFAVNESSADVATSNEDMFIYPQVHYAGRENFSPIDTTPLTTCAVIAPKALADESYFYNGRSEDQCISEYEAEVAKILSKVNPAWSDLRKIIYLHDYICDTTDYTNSYNCADPNDMIRQTAYGCIVRHNCVCDGYSRAFYDIANRMGVETYYVISDDGTHCWNITKINGKFYHVDVTWDGTYATSHNYFLKSDSAFGHSYGEYYLSSLVNIGLNEAIPIKGKYNNREFDNAPWNNVSGALTMYGETDSFYSLNTDLNGNQKIVLTDAYNNSKEILYKYEDDIERYGSIGGIVGRGNTLFVLRNGVWIDYGYPNGNTISLKLLKKSDYFDGSGVWYTSIKLSGNSLIVNKTDSSSFSIDVTDILDSSAKESNSYGSSISGDDGESPVVIQGLNLAWNTVNGKSYWYENGVKQGTYDDAQGVLGDDGTNRGREIFDPGTREWYWLDSCFNGAKAVNKEVWMPYIYQGEAGWSEGQIQSAAAASGDMAAQVAEAIHSNGDASTGRWGKWVRYDANGAMIKGWYTVQGADASIYPSQSGNTYYYDPITGLMARGWTTINGATYYFDELTGALQ